MTEVVMYWRPGCPFCVRLERELVDASVAYVKVNIWEHPEAAQIVRHFAKGNETVPTVTVGELAFVNPSIDTVLSAVHTMEKTERSS